MNHMGDLDVLSDPSFADPRRGGTEAEIRARVYPEPSILIPGLLTSGLTVLAAGPKIGKSVFAQQIEHYLSAGRPFKGWPPPKIRHRVLVLDLEGDAEATQDTSFRLEPDAADEQFARIEYLYQGDLPMGGGMAGLLVYLAELLAAGRAAQDPYSYVRVDTMRLFVGSHRGRENAYDFDAKANAVLNQLGLTYQVAVLALHHLTKASEDSGDWVERLSGSMGVSGSATSIWFLERARGATTGVLRATSRRLRESEHALSYEEGRWRFADGLTVDQALHTGIPRKVVDHLTAHPTARWQDLRELGPAATVRKALTRLGHSRTVQQVDGVWSLVRAPEDPRQQPEPKRPPSGWEHGSIGDDAFRQEPMPEPEPEPEPIEPERDPSALGRLKGAIGTVESRPCHPIPLIRVGDRDSAPWTIAVTASTNRYKWAHSDYAKAPEGWRIVIIDRRASYPSAMSNVPVAPNKLKHTGPIPYNPDYSGLYLLEVPETHPGIDTTGHVLGAGARGAETMWVTAPSVRALIKVAGSARILDSWTGKTALNVFAGFTEWCRGEQAAILGRETDSDKWRREYDEFKRGRSAAIRMIWPRSRESGLWRPDWHTAILAEANLRHWFKAVKAQQLGAELLAVSNCDEAVFSVPADAPSDWVPAPYVVGPKFGQISIKFSGTIGELRAMHTAKKAEQRARREASREASRADR